MLHCVFPMICGSGGSKSNLAKAAGAEPAAQMRDEKVRTVVARSIFPSQKGKNTSRSEHFWKLSCRKSARCCGAKHISKWKCTKHASIGPLLEVELSKKCTPLWREAHFQVKSVKNPRSQTTFGSWDVEKVHAVLARSTFPSQKCQKPTVSDHFWKLRCCGAKHISMSKCTKKASIGPLFDVQDSKKCTPLWREAHFQVKSVKNPRSQTTFGSWDVEKVHGVVARSTFPRQNVQNTPASDHFWKLSCRKSARRFRAKHISTSKVSKTHGLRPLLEVEMSKKCTPFWPEAHFQVKSVKNPRSQTIFGSWDVVARSTFPCQNVQKRPASDHFWKLSCGKSARCCGAKHISKSKCTKHASIGPLLEVELSKKCTPLWREAHFQVKSVKKLRGSGHFLTFRCRPPQPQPQPQQQQQQQQLHHSYNNNFTTATTTTSPQLQQQLQLRYNYTTLHYIKRHYTLLIFKSYEIKVFYLSITGGYGVQYLHGGFGYGTGRRYVLLGTGTVCRYVLWVRVRYGGTVRGYGTGVRCGGTVRGYVVPVQCTHRTCFEEMWCYFQNVVRWVHCTGTTYPRTVLEIAPHFLKTGTVGTL